MKGMGQMKKKRLLCLGLSMIMILSATACGGATGASSAANADAPAAEDAAGEAAVPAESGEPDAEAVAAEQTDASAVENAGEEIPESDISVKWDDSRIFLGTSLGNFSTVTTYEVKGYEDVPFIKASDYLDVILEGKEKISIQDGVMTIAVNETTGTIDAAADTIAIENPGKFRALGVVSGGIIDRPEYNTITPSVKNQSAETAGTSLTISLKDYHMPVIAYDGDILMPFLALQNTFGNVAMKNELTYNGKDYFNIIEANNFQLNKPDEAKDSVYIKTLFSGPFSTLSKASQDYADYNYYSVCLLLDIAFGHKEEKNVTTFDEYFTRINAKKALCSTDPAQSMTAEFLLFNYLFDTAHDSLTGVMTVVGNTPIDEKTVNDVADQIKSSEAGKELFEEEQEEQTRENDGSVDAILGALLEKGLNVPDIAPIIIWSNYMKANTPEGYGEQRLDISGDTAVIYFTHFMDNILKRKPSYYMDGIKEGDAEEDNFAFFYNCFEEIKEHEEVKNVVINLCNNGGGSAAGLVNILGFLSEDGEVTFTDKDMVTGSYREEKYHVDTNLDGVADDQDGFGGQYDFYIMCSGSSYSCGTALPYLAQQSGTAKIIGTYPGGGDCVLGTFVDAYGHCAAFSGMLKIGRETESGFVSDEKATTLDYDMLPSLLDVHLVPWYDADGIAEAVHRYQSGETAADYSEEEAEQARGILEMLLETMNASGEQASEPAAAQ